MYLWYIWFLEGVWIRIISVASMSNAFSLFFFLPFQPQLLTSLMWTVHKCTIYGPINYTFQQFFIKNGSHGTIHTFKNYFATVFSVFNFSKISSIQTDPKSQIFVLKAYTTTYFQKQNKKTFLHKSLKKTLFMNLEFISIKLSTKYFSWSKSE